MDKTLNRVLAQLERAHEWGFDWPDYKPLLSALISEVHEIQEVIEKGEPRERLLEEIGDLLLGCIELCRYMSVSPEEALFGAEKKFSQRFEKMKELLEKEGKKDLKGEDVEKKEELWQRAKLELAS